MHPIGTPSAMAPACSVSLPSPLLGLTLLSHELYQSSIYFLKNILTYLFGCTGS